MTLFNSRKVQLPVPGTSEADFDIVTTYHDNGSRQFYVKLKVTRSTDGRRLYPFDGASQIGPYPDHQAAFEAATALGRQIIRADLNNPEL
jgi:hypothetical protein